MVSMLAIILRIGMVLGWWRNWETFTFTPCQLEPLSQILKRFAHIINLKHHEKREKEEPTEMSVELHYGPCNENGIIKHRINRLLNLTNYLKHCGVLVDLVPSIYVDTLEVIVALRVAFRCRLSFLSHLSYRVFGLSHDPVLVRAITAIQETFKRVGQGTQNLPLPGIYKEIFNMRHDFGSGVLHYNYPDLMQELDVEDDDDFNSNSSQSAKSEKCHRKKAIKFSDEEY